MRTAKSLRKVAKYLIHRLFKGNRAGRAKVIVSLLAASIYLAYKYLYILRVASIYPMCSRYISNIQQLYVLRASDISSI